MEQVNIGEKYVAFWGSEFSNFYPCAINLEGHTWGCSEQYFMWKKAITFNDKEIANQIWYTPDPKEAKKLGRKIKGFSDEVWDKVKEQVMYDVVLAKFTQNTTLANLILSSEFDNKHFVEGSPYDQIWGVGIIFSDPAIMDEKNWKGKNLLGKTLDMVRDKMKKREVAY